MPAIPVVNLYDFTHGTPKERERFIKTWGDGLREYGFATVDRHDVPLDLTHRLFEEAARFFASPDDRKRRYIVPNSGGARGYTAFGKERAVGATAHDLKEFWHVGQETPAGALAAMYPPNVWPSDAGAFRHTVLEIYRALEKTALQMLRATALYLELPEDHFASMATDGNSVLRIIHYPPIPPGGAPAGAVRAAAHEDINLITLLCEASTGGLEVLTRDGTWLPISSLDGQIVADAGDMLELATNGELEATTHRVVNPPESEWGRSRYSMPFFVHPRPEVMLDPKPLVRGGVQKYSPISAHDYLTARLREIGLYDADPFQTIG